MVRSTTIFPKIQQAQMSAQNKVLSVDPILQLEVVEYQVLMWRAFCEGHESKWNSYATIQKVHG
jgi:hypothetical protein